MRIGIHLANWGPWADSETIAALAVRAEALGFDAVWVSDHIVAPLEVRSAYPGKLQTGLTPAQAATHFEPLITLAYAAGMTRRVRLGTSVFLVPLRNPVLAGKMIATLDALAGGRVILGVGAGWLAEEFPPLGAPPFSRRGAAMDEALRIYRSLWEEDVSQFDGAEFEFAPLRSYPKPSGQPRLPIWVGGHSEAGMRRALRFGDGWHSTHLSPEAHGEAMAVLRRLAAELGRDLAGFSSAARCDVGVGLSLDGARGDQLFGSAGDVLRGLDRYGAAGSTDLVVELQPRDSRDRLLDALAQFAEVCRGAGYLEPDGERALA
jgi:probable F420-dependent oxidoreductase